MVSAQCPQPAERLTGSSPNRTILDTLMLIEAAKLSEIQLWVISEVKEKDDAFGIV